MWSFNNVIAMNLFLAIWSNALIEVRSRYYSEVGRQNGKFLSVSLQVGKWKQGIFLLGVMVYTFRSNRAKPVRQKENDIE